MLNFENLNKASFPGVGPYGIPEGDMDPLRKQ